MYEMLFANFIQGHVLAKNVSLKRPCAKDDGRPEFGNPRYMIVPFVVQDLFKHGTKDAVLPNSAIEFLYHSTN